MTRPWHGEAVAAVWFIIYNEKALWALVLGVVCGLGVGSFTGALRPGLLTGGLVTLAIDLYGRITGGEASPALVHPDAGGHVWFIPIWIVAGLVTAAAGAAWMGWF